MKALVTAGSGAPIQPERSQQGTFQVSPPNGAEMANRSEAGKQIEPPSMSQGLGPIPGGYAEHAPLALFSLGSLAIGGVFYGINVSSRHYNVNYTAGGRSTLASAVGAAGVTALIAGASYFFFTDKAGKEERTWDARLSGGVSPDGEVDLGALLTLPLPSLFR